MRPLIIAHRGASHLAPENTLTAFRLAKTLGADGFECDVQITRDRHLVVAHDYLTDLKTGVHGNIPDMDFDDLRQLDFGKWKSPEFAGEKIPTLEEVLEAAQDFRMVHIELKPYLDRDEEIVDRVIDAVLDAGLEEKAVLTSFEYGTLRRVKERMPQMATCAMTLSPESQLSQPATFWEKLGLKKTDPLVEKLSSPQALSEAAALLEDPSSLDEENSVLIYYLKDRLDFLYSIFPRHEPGRNSAAVLLSDGFCELCGPVRLPGGLRRAGVPRLFPGQRPCLQRPRPRLQGRALAGGRGQPGQPAPAVPAGPGACGHE